MTRRLLASHLLPVTLSSLALLGAAVAAGPNLGVHAADALRAAFGDRFVADLEDVAYGALDRVDRVRFEGARPEARWSETPAAPEASGTIGAVEHRWAPSNVGPMFADFAAEGDGTWIPVENGRKDAPEAQEQASPAPVLFKTLLHPDRTRSFAELFVVAISLDDVELHFAPGTSEPENVAPGAEELARSGRIPEHHQALLVAAFNGGFKTRHGKHGVAVDGVTLVPTRPDLCSVVGHADGHVSLGTFSKLSLPGDADFVRQSARCLVEGGERHAGLVQELTRSWGAAVGGDTVIRRSAIGIDRDGKTLFVGVSNKTTAPALADGMRHAGAFVAAQLDVNQAFPRFLTYDHGPDGKVTARSVAAGFHHLPGHYVSAESSRDFFYLTERSPRIARTPGPVLATGDAS